MTLLQIEYFLTAAEYLNFSAAAKKLFITQPALSRQISAMEEELGVALFVREHRKLCLTPEGAVLQKEFSGFVVQYREILQKVHAMSEGEVLRISIGVLSGSLFSSFMPALLDNIRKGHPNIQVGIGSGGYGKLIRGLQSGEFDIILTDMDDVADRPGLDTRRLRTYPLYLAISREQYSRESVRSQLKDFSSELFILLSPDDSNEMFSRDERFCVKAGFSPRFKLAETVEQQMFFIESGYGAGIISGNSRLTNTEGLQIVPLPELPNSVFTAAWELSTINPAVPIVVKHLEEVFEQL